MTVTDHETVSAPSRAASRPGLVVMKFGGTSVGDVQKIKSVAERIVAARAGGASVVAVLSAMGHTTDELIALAGQISPNRRRNSW